MENKATTKTPIPPTSGFPLLDSVSCLLYSVFCLPSSAFYLTRPFFPDCRRSTNVERALQIVLFLQNKANFKMGNINISTAKTKAYANEQRTMSNERHSKQTQSNPIPRAQDNIRYSTYDIRNLFPRPRPNPRPSFLSRLSNSPRRIRPRTSSIVHRYL